MSETLSTKCFAFFSKSTFSHAGLSAPPSLNPQSKAPRSAATPRSIGKPSTLLGGRHYRARRKNCCLPELGLVTVFNPFTTIDAGKLVVQIADRPRLVVDCKENPGKLVGHTKTTLVVSLALIVSSGGLDGANETLKTVPLPELPPALAVS